MYTPDHFRESDPEALHRHIREIGLGLLIVADSEGIHADPVPFRLDAHGEGSAGCLRCHVARSNPVWRRIGDGTRVLVVFQGPQAYVSPSWYPSKAETGRVVPTWNYLTVQVDGQARVIQAQDWLRRHLDALTDQQESGRPSPWSVADAPTAFTEKLIQAIVGIEIIIDRIEGKLKASQNQPESNRLGVKRGLDSDSDAADRAMARLIR